jgi:hypothetical protein
MMIPADGILFGVLDPVERGEAFVVDMRIPSLLGYSADHATQLNPMEAEGKREDG